MKGLTLIEVLFATFILILIAGAIYVITSITMISWDSGRGKLEVVQELRQASSINLQWNTPKGSKEDRMLAGTPYLEGGRVILPTEAPWLAEFERELFRFPNSTYDDQTDSLSQFLLWVRKQHDTPHQPQTRFTHVPTPMPLLSIEDIFTIRGW